MTWIRPDLPSWDLVKSLEGHHMLLDVESYDNYFCICMRSVESGARIFFEGTDYDRDALAFLMANCTIVTFNGGRYDLCMVGISYWRPDYSEAQLMSCTMQLITDEARRRDMFEQHGVPPDAMTRVDHIDLIEVAPGKVSLKLYGARLHARELRDLPYEPGSFLDEDQKEQVLMYCFNDLDLTLLLYQALKPQLDLRVQLSEQYGVDLRSKSDAQIAEQVISAELERELGCRPRRADIPPGTSFRYKAPDYVSFSGPELQRVLKIVESSAFVIDSAGEIVTPPEIAKLKVEVGGMSYTMGIGGLHSTENRCTHLSDDRHTIIDNDVTSYYPSMILNNGWYPRHLGPKFLDVYRGIVERRIKAKKEGDKVANSTLKIVINGSFGKFGSKWSILGSPDLMIQVTITGQLSMLMLIERLEEMGHRVISANTDGVVAQVDNTLRDQYDEILLEWQRETGMELESVEYRALYSRDVSNYIAITMDGKVKLKGCYRPSGLDKNPDADIVAEAVIAAIKDGVPVEQTVGSCQDMRKFVRVQKVTTGAFKDGEYVGKVIRHFNCRSDYTPIRYRGGNRVGKSDGCAPLMVMDGEVPSNLDRSAYVREARRVLHQDFHRPEQMRLML